MCWANAVRAQLRSSGESLIEWVLAVVAMPALKSHMDTDPRLVEQCKVLGELYKSEPISKHIATLIVSLKDLMQFASARAVHNRWRQIYPKSANEQSRILRMVQAFGALLGTSSTPNGKAQMMAFAFGCIQSALLHGTFEEGEMIHDLLFGAKGQYGWVHARWHSKQFLDWFAAAFGLLHSNNCGPDSDEMVATLIPGFC